MLQTEAAEPKEEAPGWLTSFLVWKPSAARARPSPAEPRSGPAPAGPLPAPSHPPDWSLLTNVTFWKVLLWLVLRGLFVELEFSLACWMYVGTRGPRERRAGEKSAYSAFSLAALERAAALDGHAGQLAAGPGAPRPRTWGLGWLLAGLWKRLAVGLMQFATATVSRREACSAPYVGQGGGAPQRL